MLKIQKGARGALARTVGAPASSRHLLLAAVRRVTRERAK